MSKVFFYILFFPSVCSTAMAGQPSAVNRQPSAQINRAAFYKAMEDNDKVLVNDQLVELKTAPENLRQAFMGAMLMKKAGLKGAPATKLQLFKKGRKMLEEAIRQDPGNAEFRFLRFMIQENAPGFLEYKNDLEADSKYIQKSYLSLPAEVQRYIEDYSKKSKVLKLGVS